MSLPISSYLWTRGPRKLGEGLMLGAGQRVVPRYGDLPTMADTGERHCWALFGPGDEFGALNQLTTATTLAAVQEVRDGKSICLSLPLDQPDLRIGSRTPHR